VKLDELWVALGFKIDAKNLEKFEGLAEKAKSTMLGLGAAIAGAATGIGLMVEKAAGDMGDVQNFAEQMGISAREVAALGKVAAENDSSLEAMKGSLRSLTVMTGQAASGVGRGAMFFKKYHIAAKNADGSTKDLNEVLGDVIDKMAGMDRVKRIALGQRLGFDDATIYLMGQGRKNFEKLRLAALKSNPLTNEDYELADKTDKLFEKAASSVGLLNKRIAVALMPTVNKVLEKFIAWTKEDGNVRRLTDALQTVVNVLEILWKNLDKVAMVIGVMMTYKLGAGLIAWAASAMATAKSLGTLAAAGSALRTLLTGGLIAAIFLVGEDLWTFYEGGESVTGLLVNKWPFAINLVKLSLVALGGALVALASGSGPLGLLAIGIGGIVLAAKELYDNWNAVSQWFVEMWAKWGTAIQVILPPVGLVVQTAKLLQAAWGPVMSWFGEHWDWLSDKIKAYIKLLALPITMMAKLLGIDINKAMNDMGAAVGNMFGGGPDTGESDFAARVAAFNNRANKGLGALSTEEGGGDMRSWGRGVAAPVSQTTNITGVNINLPNVTDPRQAAREVNRGLARVAHGGVGG